MELLTGEYRNTLDEKGRILFPAKLRNELFGESEKNILIVTQSFDRCLWLLRSLIAPAQEVELDKAGRLSIPQSLREYAGLSKDCIILGINRYMELWDSESYKSYLEENEQDLKDAAEALSTINL